MNINSIIFIWHILYRRSLICVKKLCNIALFDRHFYLSKFTLGLFVDIPGIYFALIGALTCLFCSKLCLKKMLSSIKVWPAPGILAFWQNILITIWYLLHDRRNQFSRFSKNSTAFGHEEKIRNRWSLFWSVLIEKPILWIIF